MNKQKLISDAVDRIETLFANQEYEAAHMVSSQILNIEKENLPAQQLAGLSAYKLGKLELALKTINESIKSYPGNHENYNNLALCYFALDDYKNAHASIDKAISIENKVSYLSNKALFFKGEGEYEKSLDILKKVVDLYPEKASYWDELGLYYGLNNDLENCIKCFQKSIELDKDRYVTHVNLACAYFLKGLYKEGWKEYEYRLSTYQQMNHINKIYEKEKTWKGEDLKDKTIVVYCEQGAGDIINFIRFVTKLNAKKIKLHVPSYMKELLLASGFNDIITEKDEPEEYNYHCSMMSLPYLLNLDNKDLICEPYIKSSKNVNIKEIEKYKNTFNIGIVWGGSPFHPNDKLRSIYLKQFKTIQDIPNVKLFSLQKDTRKRAYLSNPNKQIDLTENTNDMSVVDLQSYIQNFNDTAGFIEALDLVISVDTAVLHLAGAMGEEAWGLLPLTPDWRWGLKENNTFWYDSIKLYRQSKHEDWESVFVQLKKDIIQKIQQK